MKLNLLLVEVMMKNPAKAPVIKGQKYLSIVGVAVAALVALLAVRIIWEETVITFRSGPQMVGFSLAHGPYVLLLLSPLLLVIWLAIALLTVTALLVRKQRVLKFLWISSGGVVLILGLLIVPGIFWQWLFNGTFAKSPHAPDLMIDAAGQGDVKTVRAYLAHGIPIEATNYEGSTAAYVAAAGNSVPVLQWLASKGANLNAANSYGNSPLTAAMNMKSSSAADFLRANGGKEIHGSEEQMYSASRLIVEKEIERQKHRK